MFEIFSGNAIKINLAYMDQLKRLFTSYIHENLNSGKTIKSWKEIEEENTVMIARSFLKMCRYHYLIPTLLNIDTLSKFLEQTLPPITNAENEFYSQDKLRKVYDEDKNYQTTMVEPQYDLNGELTEPAL